MAIKFLSSGSVTGGLTLSGALSGTSASFTGQINVDKYIKLDDPAKDATGRQIHFLPIDTESNDEAMRIVRSSDTMFFTYGVNANEEAFSYDSSGNTTFAGNVIIDGTATIGGSDVITRSGTTAQGRLAIWQNDSAIKGDNNLFYASQYLTIGVGTAGGFAALRINAATTAETYLDFTEGASFTKRAQIQVDTNDNMYFRNTSSNTLALTIDSSQNALFKSSVGIGTPLAGETYPRQLLDIRESSGTDYPKILVKYDNNAGNTTAPTASLLLSPGQFSSDDTAPRIVGYRTADFSSAAARSAGLIFGVSQNNAAKEAVRITESGLTIFKSSYVVAGSYGGELNIGGSSVTTFGLQAKYNQGGATQSTLYSSPGYTSNDQLFLLGAGAGNTAQLVLKGNGNVGINNTAPAKKLEISSPTNSDGILLTGDGTGGGMATGNYRSIGFSYTDTDTSYGSEMKFEIPDSANHGGQISFWTDEITSPGNSVRAMTISRSQNVGIGTGSPGFATIDGYTQRGIEIKGAKELGTGPVIRLYETGSGKGAFEIRSNRNALTSGNYLAFGESADTFMVIRGDDDGGGTTTRGNVGIGTTSPVSKLQIAGTVQTDDQGRFKGWYTTGDGLALETGISAGDGYVLSYNRSTNVYTSTFLESSGVSFGVRDSGKFTFTSSGASSGNVGIGTDSPDNKLQVVAGNAQVQAWFGETSYTDSAIRIGGANGAGGRLFVQYVGDNSYIDCYGGHGSTERYRDLSLIARNLIFKTGAAASITERMRITSGGDVEISQGGSFSIGSATSEAKTQTEHTGSVDNGGRIILTTISDGMSSASAAKVTIYGDNNSNLGFYDEILVMANNSEAPQSLIAKNTHSGNAPSRTYTVVSNQLKLVMGSGTFNVNVKSEAMSLPF